MSKEFLECVVNDRGFVNKPAQITELAPTLRAQEHGNQPKVIETDSKNTVFIIDDTYGFNNDLRFYSEASPTLRAGRQGLKVITKTEGRDMSDLKMIGKLDIKGNDQIKRVYGVDGVSPTLTTCGGGTDR